MSSFVAQPLVAARSLDQSWLCRRSYKTSTRYYDHLPGLCYERCAPSHQSHASAHGGCSRRVAAALALTSLGRLLSAWTLALRVPCLYSYGSSSALWSLTCFSTAFCTFLFYASTPAVVALSCLSWLPVRGLWLLAEVSLLEPQWFFGLLSRQYRTAQSTSGSSVITPSLRLPPLR